jgi:hypothetical protein
MTGHMKRHGGMVLKVLNYLKDGSELSQADAADLWNEYNVRNKICVLRSDGWPIRSREEPSPRGGKYKVYFMDMDRSIWPDEEGAA